MTEQLNRITVHGTPVVPGIAYGPAIWPSSPAQNSSPKHRPSTRPIERPLQAPSSQQRRLSRTAFSDGLPKPQARSPRSCRPTRRWQADRGWIGAAKKSIAGGVPPSAGCDRGDGAVRGAVHQGRRCDGRARHRSRGHPRPRDRRTLRIARTRSSDARDAVGAVRGRSGSCGHRGPRCNQGHRTRDHLRRPDQPHGNHREAVGASRASWLRRNWNPSRPEHRF